MKISKLNIKRVPTVDDGIVHEGIPYFAGIGSRGTPLSIGEVMIKISYYYCMKGYGLRSGGAEGADTFFEIGADLARTADKTKGVKQIFLPRKGFFDHNSSFYLENEKIFGCKEESDILSKKMEMLAGIFHNGLLSMDEDSRKLMSRNGQQVLGPFLNDPSMAIICWTPDGAINHDERKLITGGTGQAISIASCEYLTVNNGKSVYIKDEDQQVINLAKPEHLEMVNNALSQLEIEFGSVPDWKKMLKWKKISCNYNLR